jgi:broad specificity phosphatase PhoE
VTAGADGRKAGRGRRVILWRHGQTAWNVERRFQGTTDVELTETGIGQARRAARLLASLKPDAIVASDLKRAANTAAELAALTDLDVTHDEGLRETYAGVWQGLTHRGDHRPPRRGVRRVEARGAGAPRRRRAGDRGRRPGRPVVLRHAEKLPEDGTLVVVSHGGTIRTTIGRLLGLESQHWESLGGLSNCCWSVLGEGARGWRLLEHNAGTLPEPVLGDDD